MLYYGHCLNTFLLMPFVFLFTVNLQEVQPKKDVTRNISQKQQQTQVKERRKSDENKQGKGRAR